MTEPDVITRRDLVELLVQIVTGEGQQLENLEMSDEEWRLVLVDDDGYIDVALPLDAWRTLVRLAKGELQIE